MKIISPLVAGLSFSSDLPNKKSIIKNARKASATQTNYQATAVEPQIVDMSADVVQTERYKAISLQALDKVAEDHPQLKPHLYDVKLAGMVFPFKASPYYVDELIDWEAADVRQDPFYKLVFPTLDMLTDEHREKLEAAHAEGDPKNLLATVASIREDLNPHPAGQKELNAPKEDDDLTGVQHKYSETVLVFPAAG
mmetsp:Transcript_8794/g.24351  ORF Transcript_8794/g.24351 Transcript_8794/m.24351 type:complete len:196 (-) Transcript_8794:229-816(-)